MPQDHPQFQLGILLVHGIGMQPSGETLVHWGDVLTKTISRSTGNEVKAIVEWAHSGDSQNEGRAEALVRLSGPDHTEQWMLSEGWWAEVFPAPTYSELVSWSVRALPWFIATHIARGYWRTASRDWSWADVVALATALLQLLVALALAPLFIGLLAVVLLLGLLPISQLRSLILAVQSTFTATVGDSLAFVESPIRAALIRTRILDRFNRLKRLCERTVIVAHSQGAAAVLDALGGFVHLAQGREAVLEASPVPPMPDALVTFGAGTNQLASQLVLSADLEKKIGRNPASFAIGAILVTIGLFAWLYWDVRTQRATVQGILSAGGLYLLGMTVLGLLMWASYWLIGRLAQHRQFFKKRKYKILLWTLVPLLVGGVLILMGLSGYLKVPFTTVSFLFLSLFILAWSMYMILSRDMETIVSASVRKPPGLARWLDLYASADPVPNGPTKTGEADMPRSLEIWNLGSVFADHTAYWNNLDGFVLRVVRECAEIAQSPWKKKLPDETRIVDDRAAWRVDFLRMARLSTHTIWFVVGVFLWVRYNEHMPLLYVPPSWFPVSAIRLGLLLVLIFIAVWASSAVLRWIWSWWVRAEQETVMAHGQPEGKGFEPIVGMALVVYVLLITATKFVSASADPEWEFVVDLDGLLDMFLIAFGWAFISSFVLVKLKRAPHIV